jgi:hypothetical protein
MIHRAAVDFDTPQTRAASRTEPPGMTIMAGAFLGRPRRLPCALARCRPRLHPFSNARPFELRDRAKDAHLQLARRGRGVDPLF